MATCAAARSDQFRLGAAFPSDVVCVRATFYEDEYDDKPSRICAKGLDVILPPGLTEQDRYQPHEGLVRCTVTNTRRQPSQLSIEPH